MNILLITALVGVVFCDDAVEVDDEKSFWVNINIA